MRALLALGGLLAAFGLALLIVGVRQQVAWMDCGRHCSEPSAWPITLGILMLIGGGFLLVWTLASDHAGRVLHPAPHLLAERERLRREGLRGQARALTWAEVGTSPTGDPMLEADLSIQLPGREAYRAVHRIAVPRRRLALLRGGRPLPVLIDPADPGRLVVDWGPRPRQPRARPRLPGRRPRGRRQPPDGP